MVVQASKVQKFFNPDQRKKLKACLKTSKNNKPVFLYFNTCNEKKIRENSGFTAL